MQTIDKPVVWPEYLSESSPRLKPLVNALAESYCGERLSLDRGGQLQRRALLGWAVRHSAFYQTDCYREVLSRLESASTDFELTWQQIPFVTKDAFRRRGEELRVAEVPAEHLPVGLIKSSGSTGIPVVVHGTHYSRTIWAAWTVRDYMTMNRDGGKRLAAIRSLGPDYRQPEGIRMRSWGGPIAQCFKTGPGFGIHAGHSAGHLASWLHQVKPHYLVTYPSIVTEMLDYLPAHGGVPDSLEEIITLAEPLDLELRQRLKSGFGLACSEMYSANECGYIAMPCKAGRLHLASETVYTELLDEHNRPVGPGEQGRVVITNLHNLATPLIRYELGDYARWGEGCDCGRQTPIIESVLGRVRNYAQTPDGKRFWPGKLAVIRDCEAIARYQYVQTAPDTIELRLRLDRPLTEQEQAETKQRIVDNFGYPYRINLVQVDDIPRGPTGKYEEFVSLINSS